MRGCGVREGEQVFNLRCVCTGCKPGLHRRLRVKPGTTGGIRSGEKRHRGACGPPMRHSPHRPAATTGCPCSTPTSPRPGRSRRHSNRRCMPCTCTSRSHSTRSSHTRDSPRWSRRPPRRQMERRQAPPIGSGFSSQKLHVERNRIRRRHAATRGMGKHVSSRMPSGRREGGVGFSSARPRA